MRRPHIFCFTFIFRFGKLLFMDNVMTELKALTLFFLFLVSLHLHSHAEMVHEHRNDRRVVAARS